VKGNAEKKMLDRKLSKFVYNIFNGC